MMTGAKILVVDDESSIRFSLEALLTRDGFEVITAESGEAALDQMAAETFDLALVDLRLPGIDGLEVLRTFRSRQPETVVIVLTAHASLETAVEALRHGAHDYLFKPCKTVELRDSIRRGLRERQKILDQRRMLRQLEQHLAGSLANLRATMKDASASDAPETMPPANTQPLGEVILEAHRKAQETPAAESGRFLQQAGFVVDFDRHIISLNDHLLELSPTEFSLLAYLISESPRVVSAQELVKEAQGYESEQWEARETVRYHIYRLRQKIKAATGQADTIDTVRGIGYRIGS
jgi:DNA-binding response OmpR family regulator